MSLQVPTTAELDAVIIASWAGKFGQTIPVFLKAFLRVASKTLAGVLTILYKYGGSMLLQQFVSFAGTSVITVNGTRLIPLVEWGRLVGVGDPTAATRGEYEIEITVVNQVGSLLANTSYRNNTNGFIYLTLADVPLSSSTVTVNMRASSDPDGGQGKGTAGALIAGESTVELVTPNANVIRVADVITENTAPIDAEDWEVYREQVSDRFRKQPQGGAYADYEYWSELVADVINAYPYTGPVPNIVDVYVEVTATVLNPDGLADTAKLLEVWESIQTNESGLATRRPVNAYVRTYSITRTAFSVTVNGLTGGTEEELFIQGKISDALQQYFLSRAPFISGLTLGSRRDRITKAEVGGAVQDVCSAYGAIFENVIVKAIGGDPIIVYPLQEGEKSKVSFVYYT